MYGSHTHTQKNPKEDCKKKHNKKLEKNKRVKDAYCMNRKREQQRKSLGKAPRALSLSLSRTVCLRRTATTETRTYVFKKPRLSSICMRIYSKLHQTSSTLYAYVFEKPGMSSTLLPRQLP